MTEEVVLLSHLEDLKLESGTAIVIDELVLKLWQERMPWIPQAHCISSFQAAEENKSFASCRSIWESWADAKLNRNSVVLAIGGGCTTDIVGFCASTYKRGISFSYLPTTLLAMVDAAIGGKTGFNAFGAKNQIGTFSCGEKVYICIQLLETLSEEEKLSGRAEILKYGLTLDPTLLTDSYWKSEELADIVIRCIHLKQDVVNKDRTDQKGRQILNFGHTIGHGLEGAALAKGTHLPHGFAVAAGMWMALEISKLKLGLSEDNCNQHQDAILLHFPKAEDIDANLVLELMAHDKKRKHATHSMILLKSIGQAFIDCPVSDDEVLFALSAYKSS